MPRHAVLLTASICLLGGCESARKQGTPSEAELSADQAAKRVWDAPQVTRVADQIRKIAPDDVRVISLCAGEHSTSGRQYFRVQLAEDHPTHLATIAWFLVDRRTGEILHEDVSSGSLQKLDQWEKSRASSPE